MQLAATYINGGDRRRPVLEKTISKAARRRTSVKRASAGHVYPKTLESCGELLAPPAHVPRPAFEENDRLTRSHQT
jgi:hypothetical protein